MQKKQLRVYYLFNENIKTPRSKGLDLPLNTFLLCMVDVKTFKQYYSAKEVPATQCSGFWERER